MMCKEIVACCECFASDKVSHHRWKSLLRHWHRVEIGQVLFFFPRRNYATSACDCLPLPRISLRRARHFTKQWNVSQVTARAQFASCLPVPSSGMFFRKRAFGLLLSRARGRRRFRDVPSSTWFASFWIQFRLLAVEEFRVRLRWLLIQGICLPFSFNFLSYGFYGSPQSTGVGSK